jgi:hypothetical protein
MPIPMEIPAHLLQGVMNGIFIRIGCTVRDVASGQIVAHLKELPGLSRLLCAFPMNPVLGGAESLLQFGQWIDTHSQLKHIQGMMRQLQLVSSVGAVASVAGLGVSVAGFAVVMRQLARLEQNLNQGLDRIRVEVERLHHRQEMLEMAELHTAWERLAGANSTSQKGRQEDLLKDADGTFQKYRHYYHSLIVSLRPVGRAELTLPQVRELLGRFVACSVAESVFADRIAVTGIATKQEQQTLHDQVKRTREFCKESQDRVVTSAEEVRWGERQGMTPGDYLCELQSAPGNAIVFIAHNPSSLNS